MPTDANGVYSLPSGYLATAGGTIVTTQHNPVFEDVASGITARLMANGANPMTAPLKIVDGTVSAPGLAFNTAQNTGIYKTSGGFGVSVGGVRVAEFIGGGIVKGARYIGELIRGTWSAAPSLCVLPFGQTLSRAAFPDLWTLAQTEIAAGNTFYNTGDGSTTFGIGDTRARAFAVKDNLGGSAANLLTGTSITPDGNTIGAKGGTQTHALTLGQLATGITSVNAAQSITVTTTDAGIPNANTALTSSGAGGGALGQFGNTLTTLGARTSTGSNSIAVTSNNTSGQAHPNVQPTMITSCALFAGA